MAFIDPTTPSGVQPNGFSSGFTLTFSDEFNSTSLKDTWQAFRSYQDTSYPNGNFDINAGNNSCLRIWPQSPFGTGNETEFRTENGPGPAFTQRYGFWEVRVQCPRGKGLFLSQLWLFNDGNEEEIDVGETFAYENGDWLVDTSLYQLKNTSFTVWTDGGGGSTTQAGQLYLGGHNGSVHGYDGTLCTQFHTWGLHWTSSGGLKWYFDGVLQGTIGDPWGGGNNSQLYTLLGQLWYGPRAGISPPDGNTPTGTGNPFLTDYVRIWSINGTPTPGPPQGSPPPPPFNATLTTAPTDGATISGTVPFGFDFAGVQNAELLPGTGYTPSYGTFTLNQSTGKATLNWNTTNVANAPITVRIAAFDQAAGVSPANELTVMGARTYTVNNAASPPPSPPPSSSNWPYGRNSAGFDSMTFYEEFVSGTVPDTSKWKYNIYYQSSDPTVNYKVTGGNLKIWPQQNSGGNFFDRIFTTETFFTQQYGYFETSIQALYGDGVHPVVGIIGNNLKDIGYMHAYGHASAGGWTSASAIIDYACAVFDIPTQAFDFDQRPGTAALHSANLAAAQHIFACEWTPNNIRFFFDGTQVEECVTSLTGQYYPYIGLAFQTNETSANPAGTLSGSAHSIVIDYVRVWTLHNNANSVPGTAAPPPFAATVATAPVDGASISGVVAFRVTGNQIRNCELLPATGYTPNYGTFSLSSSNTVAKLNWSSTAVANGNIQLRISAFDQPAGSPANEIVAMQPRTYHLNNTSAPAGPPPTPTPTPPPPPPVSGLQWFYSVLNGKLPWSR